MESPAAAAKLAIQPSTIIKTLFAVLAVSAVLELLGWTSLLFSPIAFIKGKFKGTSN